MTELRIGTSVDTASGTAPDAAAGTPAADVSLNAAKFNRHTFWCGQSGSGKTYALGVVLEQLLLETELPLLILDPNADFTRITSPHPESDASGAREIAALDIRVLRSGNAHGSERDSAQDSASVSTPDSAPARADGRLHARFADLSAASKAAVLQLDPIHDADEYNVLIRSEGDGRTFRGDDYLATLRASDHPGERALGTRIENLQTLDWDLWALGQESVTDVIDARPRATVMDLGGFSHPAEPKVAALAVLEHLWAKREERRPVLIVIDEAHNLCLPNPVTAVERALTDQLVQIAAEGRKFGLWLLLSTQRPTKVHPNVISQCDNLCLMRMNSPRDLVELGEVFGFVPEQLLQRSPDFKQGQALVAGGFVGQPTVTQMRARLTAEGGSDVRVPLKGERVRSES
ncbi:ATP-binding protein [Leucobacter sp. BZR 635]